MATFFADSKGRYRYWYIVRPGRDVEIKIQCKAEFMDTFRKDLGRKVSKMVDILSLGGGWYSVSSVDVPVWDTLFGNHTDCGKIWVAALNKAFLSEVNANPVMTRVKYVKRVDHTVAFNTRLQKLADKFSHFQ